MKTKHLPLKHRATKTQATIPALSKLSVKELNQVSGGITSYGGVQM